MGRSLTGAGRLPPAPFLYPLTDARLGGESGARLVERLVRAGAAIVQLRDKDLPDGAFLVEVRRAQALAGAAGARLVVNDRLDVALIAGADGVHLGDQDLPPEEARRLGGADLILGRSTHSVEEALAVSALPVDYIALGPIYPSPTKPGRPPLGPEAIRRVKARTGRPVVAIGGIRADRLAEVVEAGADGIAVVSAVLVPGSVEERTRLLLHDLAAIGRPGPATPGGRPGSP